MNTNGWRVFLFMVYQNNINKRAELLKNIKSSAPSARMLGDQKYSSSIDFSRYTRWPKFINLQRQRRIFAKKLKLPGLVDYFKTSLDKNMTRELFRILINNREKITSKEISSQQPLSLKGKDFSIVHGINKVTKLVRDKKAFFVVIAQDVNPIECVIWLPSFCVKQEIPYCIVKSKSKLGNLVSRKKISTLALKLNKDTNNVELEKIRKSFYMIFNQRYQQATERWSSTAE